MHTEITEEKTHPNNVGLGMKSWKFVSHASSKGEVKGKYCDHTKYGDRARNDPSISILDCIVSRGEQGRYEGNAHKKE